MPSENNEPIIKHLRFELTPEQYGKFWIIGGLLKLKKKKGIFLRMMEVIEEAICNER